jgi:hypothetical protein
VLCCACPGLVLCVFGGAVAAGVPITSTLGGQSTTQSYPATYGIGFICLSIILIVIPVVVGILTLRQKPAAAESPVVPPS